MSAFTDASLLVETTAGTVRGAVDGATHRWLGIPYAASTAGANRYRAPKPREPWDGVRDALEFGDVAPQEQTRLIPLPVGLQISEDCLNLNVWAPATPRADGSPRPVMVWVHGGAYFIGFSAQPVYNGRSLVEHGDVIVVTLNYRLGALGFLDFSAWASDEHPFDSNLGLSDIIAALEWVRDNIASFGGDPQCVTLFGESAGAGCVTTLLTAPRAEGLFHRAIAQSSPATSVYGPERATGVAREYLRLLGVSEVDAPRELREIDAVTLAGCTQKLLNSVALSAPGTVAFAPVVDGDLVPEYPVEVFRAGRSHPVPLIIGTNHDEAALFKLMKSPLMPISESTIHEMFEQVSRDNPDMPVLPELEDHIVAAYPDFPKQKGAMEISRDAGFRMPSIWVAEAHSRVAPTWMYRFDQAPPLLRLLGIGASHATELAYVFGTLPGKVRNMDIAFRLGGLTEAKEISARMQTRWLQFARAGNPETTELEWPGYEVPDRTTLLINRVDALANDPEGDVRAAWGEQVLGYR